MNGITSRYRGFSKDYLSSNQILELFDKLWGNSCREFPKYPNVIGGISAFWSSADGNKHHANNIAELLEPYEKELTYDIHITGKVNDGPRCTFVYIPAKKEGIAEVTAATDEIVEEKLKAVREMCPEQEKPIVFISYAGEELSFAEFLRTVILRITGERLDVFVAKRMRPGTHPLKVMMDEKLKYAQAIVPICSRKSKIAPWVWWETASVWARDFKIYPLCIDLSLGDFGPPLNLVAQGKSFFVQSELEEVLHEICQQFGIGGVKVQLTAEEVGQYHGLEQGCQTEEVPVNIKVAFSTMEQTQQLHKYSFVFDVENTSKKKYDDVVVMLSFPEDYLEKKEWTYPHLKSSPDAERPEYLRLTFTFSNLPEAGKKEFSHDLLPGQTLRVFGSGKATTRLIYEMDRPRWQKKAQYQIFWKVYIDGGAPHEGSESLSSLQNF